MRKIMFLIPLLLLASCSAYEYKVNTDACKVESTTTCPEEVPQRIWDRLEVAIATVDSVMAHTRIIIADGDTHWAFVINGHKVQFHSRYKTAIVKNWGVPLILCIGVIITLLLGFGLSAHVNSTLMRKKAYESRRMEACEKEIEAAQELQKAGIASSTRESDLIARQSLLIDGLTEQNEKILADALDFVEFERTQRTFNTAIFVQVLNIEKERDQGNDCSDKVHTLFQQIIQHSTQ